MLPGHSPRSAFSDDAAAVVAYAVPCRRCGNDLRGELVVADCPGCGRSVLASLEPDLLVFADPQWVRQLGRGTLLLMLSFLLALVVGCVGGMIDSVTGWSLPTLLMMAAVGVVYAAAEWDLTRREPRPFGVVETDEPFRRFTRTALCLGSGLLLADVVFLLVPWPALGHWFLVATLSQAAAASLVVGQLGTVRYLGKLAARASSTRGKLFARVAFPALCVSAGFLVLGGSIGFFSRLAGNTADYLSLIAATVGTAGLVAFGTMYVFVLARLAKRFERQATFAARVRLADVEPALTSPAEPEQGFVSAATMQASAVEFLCNSDEAEVEWA